MCMVCGCSGEETKTGRAGEGAHFGENMRFRVHADGTAHSHNVGAHHPHGIDPHGIAHRHGHELHYGLGPAHAHAPGMSQARMVQVERDILAKNDGYAAANRDYFREHGIFALNLVSSPGSGKTTLLVSTIRALQGRYSVCVIEGDQQTSNDADRIRATGAPALQINTGRGCHLDAYMVGQALEQLRPADGSLMLIENVGNLVCPSSFDLGEAHKVAVLSVTEGEDKPLKYPDMFAAADLMLLNKSDLLPHLEFDVTLAIDYARRVNPGIRTIVLSARTGEGMELWLDWLSGRMTQTAMRTELAEMKELSVCVS
ncbi:MAG TPA: hydrogenase nickel incorporation protein HypB [Gallionella sp.]|nr:hydrogenase nickel incorporation protein HypB [Gallionella sp.]